VWSPLVILILLLIFCISAALAASERVILRCPNHTMAVVEQSRIQVIGEISSLGWIARSHDGDCRKYLADTRQSARRRYETSI
jgi:hypothetical protein